MDTAMTSAQIEAKRRLGPQWRRRLNTMLDTLIDAEPAIHAAGHGNIGSAIGNVADALRELVGDQRYS